VINVAQLKFRLSKKNLIRTAALFNMIRRQGRRLVMPSFILNWFEDPGLDRPCLGVIVRRDTGSAVKRNRAKRLLREVFRLHQQELVKPAYLVLVARKNIVNKCFREIEEEYLNALSLAGLIKK